MTIPPTTLRKIVILGATGSIGHSTLAVIRDNPGRFAVAGLAAKTAGDKLLALAREFPQAAIAVVESAAAGAFHERLSAAGWRGILYEGADAATRLVAETAADDCVAAISGTAGLRPAFAAAAKGMRILLANKEVLVSAGDLFLPAAKQGGAVVLPLDSEHSALWQCLDGRDRAGIARLVVTASGGPFRDWPRERIEQATPEEALRHPVWRMGAKISIDSASLANKALEVIEATQLFSMPLERVDILVHPQAVVHGLVEFVDGSVIAHMGVSDMRSPISAMLHYPAQVPCGLPRLDLTRFSGLTFAEPDCERFPVLGLGLAAAKRGGLAPAAFNAANETAVELFLAGRIHFGAIAACIARALRDVPAGPVGSLERVEQTHAQARQAALAEAETVSFPGAAVTAAKTGRVAKTSRSTKQAV